jgi:FkbH-like protein
LIQYTNRYLRYTGWKREPAWDFFDIWIRASKNGIWLNIYIVDETTRRLPTVIRDAQEMGSQINSVIGVLTYSEIPQELRNEAEAQGTFVINPSELQNVEEAVARVLSLRQKLLESSATMVSPGVPSHDHTAHVPVRATGQRPVAQPAAQEPEAISGVVEWLTRGEVRGWAFKAGPDVERLRIECKSDGLTIGSGTADIWREDLQAAGFGDGRHAFVVALASAISPFSLRRIDVFAVSSAGQQSRLRIRAEGIDANLQDPHANVSAHDATAAPQQEETQTADPMFDERHYLTTHPDVARAVAAGHEKSGWRHYIRIGQFERRRIQGFDANFYIREYPDVANDLKKHGNDLSPYGHYLKFGRGRGYLPRFIEPVRLVIWDLDDTFWEGTVTEGGIKRYVQDHHDMVIELARRGIMSSICSKNDDATIKSLLKQAGILDYFIFPSVSWEPKGGRIAAIVEAVQLRPATVMFIDDNPGNRAEAVALLPDLQVEDEKFLPKLLADWRFKGKADASLERLAQYKLLEQKKQDEQSRPGGNEEFLRSCDIRVYIEYDVDPNIDRAIELINRTNQLNYTKRRLPEDIERARVAFREELRFFARQAGLIHVRDKYGDYGIVGIFVTENLRDNPVPGLANRTLRHYCFSCRTLGMQIERWVYDYLGRPELRVVGEVLTDLRAERCVDWVRQMHTLDGSQPEQIHTAQEIRLYGGCEANSIGVYLNGHAKRVEVMGNFRAGGLFVRINGASLALSMFNRSVDEFQSEADALGLPAELLANGYILGAPIGTSFVFSCGFDAQGSYRYRHRIKGWDLVFEPASAPAITLDSIADHDLHDKLATLGHNKRQVAHVLNVARHVRSNYDLIWGMSNDDRISALRRLIDMVPSGSNFVLVLDHDQVRREDGSLFHAEYVTNYNRLARAVAGEFEFASAVSFSDAIDREDQIQIGGNHYDRVVYLRLAESILSSLRRLPKRR